MLSLTCGGLPICSRSRSDVLNPHRKPVKLTKSQNNTVLKAVNKANEHWIHSFNSEDAAGCANAYEIDGIMTAKPFGTFADRETIQACWENLMSQGYSDVRYIDRDIKSSVQQPW